MTILDSADMHACRKIMTSFVFISAFNARRAVEANDW